MWSSWPYWAACLEGQVRKTPSQTKQKQQIGSFSRPVTMRPLRPAQAIGRPKRTRQRHACVHFLLIFGHQSSPYRTGCGAIWTDIDRHFCLGQTCTPHLRQNNLPLNCGSSLTRIRHLRDTDGNRLINCENDKLCTRKMCGGSHSPVPLHEKRRRVVGGAQAGTRCGRGRSRA